MKALTIYQPYASLLATGAKKYETRSWATKYRGKIAIHAGLALGFPFELYLESQHTFWTAFGDAMIPEWQTFQQVFDCAKALPRGAVIATAELVECWHIVAHPGTDINAAAKIPVGAELDVPKHHPRFADIIVPSEQEQLFGDWKPNCYAWEYRNIKIFFEPIPAKGQQGLWNWGDGE